MSASPSADPGELLQQAFASYRAGDLAEVEAICARLAACGVNGPASQLLALVRMDRGDLAGAHVAVREALVAAPEDPPTMVCAGMLAVREDRIDDALGLFRRAVQYAPGDATALCWLGTTLQNSGDHAGAHEVFAECARANPHFVPGWCNLGGVCVLLGRLDDAERAYREAIARDPTWTAGHRGLVWLLSTRGDEVGRRDAVRAWTRACPQHPVAVHLAAAIGDTPAPARCPEQFVAAYFDDFARDYDRVLANLGTTIAATFAALWRDGRIAAANVLDLGCGTGAASAWLVAAGRRLVGVDLSAAMLGLAARAGHHAELHRADALAFLAATTERFDAIVLADVVPYFGDLAPLLTAVAGRLTTGGHVLLSFESSPAGGTVLASTGRYQHDEASVRSAAAQTPLEVVAIRPGVLRNEGSRPVPGACVVLRMFPRQGLR